MSSLYRKYRPEHFSELVGQDPVTNALKNAIREDRTGHAYLFSGQRGTGKTTTARILARALNCLDLGADGEPCGKCENCMSFAAGSFFDFVELDAASKRRVEEMRALIPGMHLGLGATSRNKVYVFDEVHMLTPEASNTLLKTLEEPPEHVVFVLATTEPGRVLPTIRSRTQHFEFTLLTHDQVVGHLADILAREGIEVDAATLDLIARRSGGSARDALSMLDQAIALGGGQLDAAQVQEAFGGVAFEQRVAVLDAVADEDVAGVLVDVNEMFVAGHDARTVANDLLRTLRDAFLCANAGGRVPHDGSAEEAKRLTELAERIGNAALVRGIEVLGQLIFDLRGLAVVDPRLSLEVAVVRLARRESRTREETLLDRIERLEKQIGAGGAPARADAAPPVASPIAPVPDATPARAARPAGSPMLAARPAAKKRAAEVEPVVDDAPAVETPEPEVATAQAPAAELELDEVIAAWPIALDKLKAPVRATIQEAQPIGIDRGAIVFGAPPKRLDAINTRFRNEAPAIKAALAALLGSEPKFMVRAHDFDAVDALAPVSKSGNNDAPPAESEPAEEHIDLDDLTEAPDAPPPDPTARLVEGLGAQVVEEHSRD